MKAIIGLIVTITKSLSVISALEHKNAKKCTKIFAYCTTSKKSANFTRREHFFDM